MDNSTQRNRNDDGIKIPPRGVAILVFVGPAFIWCAEYIGTGEIILATRTGAILGNAIVWAVVLGIFFKYWIGMSGARYTVCTGEAMIDMFNRIPGPRHWVVWIVLIAQFFSAAISIGSVASATGIFINNLIPVSRYFGGFIFMLSAIAALLGTQLGQLAGWPRLLADSFRICIPGFQQRFPWKTQFRMFLLFFSCTNMVIVFTLGLKPVVIVQVSAILDGLLLTPLQALWVAIGLYIVMPRLFNDETREILRPHWIFALGLIIAFIGFGYLCIFQIPTIL